MGSCQRRRVYVNKFGVPHQVRSDNTAPFSVPALAVIKRFAEIKDQDVGYLQDEPAPFFILVDVKYDPIHPRIQQVSRDAACVTHEACREWIPHILVEGTSLEDENLLL